MELHKENKFDIIHSQEESALYFIKKKISKKYDIPIIITLHTTVYDNIKTRINIGISWTSLLKDIASIFWCPFYWSKCYLLKELILAKDSDGIIATSDQQEEIFKTIYNVEKGKLFKAYNGIDISLFKPKEINYNKFSIRKKEKVILAIARLERDKGIQYLIKAMPKICRNIKNSKLIIVGDGLYKENLMALWRKSKVKDKIIFTGFLDMVEVKNLLNRCNVFVNPTIRNNGYDLIMAEAMACEKVVISSDIGSTPTLIKDGRDGILFKTKDTNQLIEKVKMILNNRELTKRIGKSARKKVLKDFTSKIMAKRTIQIYNEVIKNEKKKNN